MSDKSSQAVVGRRRAEGLTVSMVRSAYSRWAPIYDAVFWGPTLWGRDMAVARVNAIGGKVLEVGVGTGMALPCYGPSVEVTGIDISPEMLVKTAERVERERLKARVAGVAVMDAGHLAFPDNSFDVAVAMYVITAVPDPDACLAEMSRVVRPGGTIIIVSHFRSERGGWKVVEHLAEPFTTKLGWDAGMPVERVLQRRELALVERCPVPPLNLYTLLRFEKRVV
jgi:phosphatidylethanolamine/phosphatidyl-N-methylethanolamine N-methyltransferase